MSKHSPSLLIFGSFFCLAVIAAGAVIAGGAVSAGTQVIENPRPGQAVERHLPPDDPPKLWALDPKLLDTETGDEMQVQEGMVEGVETIKLENVIPPIRFESGVANIPQSYVASLRKVLDGMRDRRNVRLHLVGHADDQRLSESLVKVYGDNAGLSRERAGEVAEFLQKALMLPPESISYEWAGDSRPIASNATAHGRALNRRVEVQVWYDEPKQELAMKEALVAEDFKRVKVCRMQTLCRMRFKEGHARRTRIKNLVPALRFEDESVTVPEAFVAKVRQALDNLSAKQNVTVKFIGHTDDAPLTERNARIYGNHLALSKARAHRVALAIQEALALPAPAVASDGRGTSQPLTANETPQGRTLNRRIEVEFWHDDPLQELPEQLQLCPDTDSAEILTKVYDPPWGRIAPLQLEQGQVIIPPGYTEQLRRALADISGKANARLRFVGYTRNERLDRRTAQVYGDDIGLSAARARRAMQTIRQEMQLEASQVEHEGRGFVHSEDVVNVGFIQGETSHVVVQAVYDEPAIVDDYEGVEITRLKRELSPQNPFGLNLMRITNNGEPIDDPGRHSADIQRCTDVALEGANIKFQYDNLKAKSRLAVTATPDAVVFENAASETQPAPTVHFKMYSNYASFIEHAEVRVFEAGQSLQAEPLEIIAIDAQGFAQWQPLVEKLPVPSRELRYVLRAYDKEGRFDETRPQPLWLIHKGFPIAGASVQTAMEPPVDVSSGTMAETDSNAQEESAVAAEAAVESDATVEEKAEEAVDLYAQAAGDAQQLARHQDRRLLSSYGESELSIKNIHLRNAGAVTVRGSGIPAAHTVWVAGRAVPTDPQGNFIAEEIVPAGIHTIEVAVLDSEGNGDLFLRDLKFERKDWFYVGMADMTASSNSTSGPADLLQGADAPYDSDSSLDGRLAFYVNGKFGADWKLTASADTREGPVQDLLSHFLDKSPDALFRRIDPDNHYPTFGDDSTVEETAATLGKFYVKLSQDENHALWGNFKVGYLNNELAHVDRGLYGANVRYLSESVTSFGEQRFAVDGFAAEPGTIPSRNEFRGTGGSLYYLRNQDILVGSERVRIELRDKDSGIVTGVVNLRPVLDYDIDYLQGRILLTEPLSSTVDDRLLVRSGSLSGDEAYLVARYEFTPGFESLDALCAGGQAHYWVGDYLKFGVTTNTNEEGDSDSSLNAADVTLRKSNDTWLKLQSARSEGLLSSSLYSNDGGFGFFGEDPLSFTDASAGAHRAELSVGFADVFGRGAGRVTLYIQNLEAGYSAPGMSALTDTERFGGTFSLPVGERLQLRAKADSRTQEQGLKNSAQEVNLSYQLSDRWNLAAGVRNDLREDRLGLVPLTQEQGERTDAVMQVAYDPMGKWRAYAYVQDTLSVTEAREDNGRIGSGGSYRFNDKFRVDAEVSDGDLGAGAKVGTNYLYSDRSNLYLNYALENERTDNGYYGRRGNLISGVKQRLSDSSSVYLEERYQTTGMMTGLTHATGVSLAANERWNLGANADVGTLRDRLTGAETERTAGGARVGYGFASMQLASGIEYRVDKAQQLDASTTERTTWLFRNSFKYQLTPSWRLLGKLNHSLSDSSLGEFYDGGYTEAVIGYGYRPVAHDRLNALAKYTYFHNVPTTDQVLLPNTPVEFIQKSHIASVDLTYALTGRWSLGGKYAHRLGQMSLEREDPQFFDNSAQLYILRTDWRFRENWEAMAEARMLDLADLNEQRSGALIAIYRRLGKHLKMGAGYNFTDFSEDLTDLSFTHQGAFVNVVGTL